MEKRQQAAGQDQILTAAQLHAELEKITERAVSLAYVCRLLHRHGWRKLGLCPRHPKAQPDVRKRFKKSPQILQKVVNRIPPRVRLHLVFQDEARFGCINSQRRCWVPWPLRRIVGQHVIREFVYGLAAVSPLDEQLCSLVPCPG